MKSRGIFGYALISQSIEHKNLIRRFELGLRPRSKGGGHRLIFVEKTKDEGDFPFVKIKVVRIGRRRRR